MLYPNKMSILNVNHNSSTKYLRYLVTQSVEVLLSEHVF